jgi:hypothetical protein
MNAPLQQPYVGGKMSLDDCKSIKSLTILSNLITALVMGVAGMLVSSFWILFT